MSAAAPAGGLPEGLVVAFPAGLPGFPLAHRFSLEELGEPLRPLARLRSLDVADLAFTVAPASVFPDYSVEIDDDDQTALGIEDHEDVVVLVVLTVPPPPQPPTANLLGPVVVNRRTGAAAQVVQHRSTYRVAEPLPGGQQPGS